MSDVILDQFNMFEKCLLCKIASTANIECVYIVRYNINTDFNDTLTANEGLYVYCY